MADFDKMNVAALQGRPIGRVLVKMNIITREKVHEALAIQKEKGGPLGQILVDLGDIDEETLTFGLAFQAGMEYIDLDRHDIDKDVIKQISAQMANAYKVLPLEYDEAGRQLTVALASADNFRATDDLRTLMSFSVSSKIADADKLEKALQKHYGDDSESIGDLLNELNEDVAFLADPTPDSLGAALLQAFQDEAERAAKTTGARALYDRKYSRTAYVSKIEAVLEKLSG